MGAEKNDRRALGRMTPLRGRANNHYRAALFLTQNRTIECRRKRAFVCDLGPAELAGDESSSWGKLTSSIVGISVPVTDLCRKKSVSDARIYNWRKKYGGMDVPDANRLRSLEGENSEAREATSREGRRIR